MSTVQVRTLLAGVLVAAVAAVLAAVGPALGVGEVWPVLLVVGAGLLVGLPQLRHAVALSSGIVAGALATWAAGAALPDVAAGRAAATAIGVLSVTAVAVATAGRLRMSVQLVGLAAALAHVGPTAGTVRGGGTPLLGAIASGTVTLLLAVGVGLLVAQVAQLTATGRARPGARADARADVEQPEARPDAGPDVRALVAVLAAASVLTSTIAPAPVLADDREDAKDAAGVVDHLQTVTVHHAADGTATRATVVTRVATSGAGDVTVELRDQAVRDLRSLTGLAVRGPLGERGAPDVTGRRVTHRLGDGDVVRTVAALDRTVPVRVDVAVTLDGEPIAPAAVVGRSGRLRVTYTLTNLTVEPRELRLFDGTGRPRTVVRDVAVPYVGELVVPLDDRYGAVRVRGGRLHDGMLRADVVLAEPVGTTVRTVTWTADVEHATLPPVQVRLAPVTLGDPARSGLLLDRLRISAGVLRELSDTAGLALTAASAVGTVGAAEVEDPLARTIAILEGLLSSAGVAGAEANELRALIDAQDARVRDGDGVLHPLLDADGIVGPSGARPRIERSTVYVLEVAGAGDDGAPAGWVRLLLAAVLLGAVGLLGRATSRIIGPDVA